MKQKISNSATWTQKNSIYYSYFLIPLILLVFIINSIFSKSIEGIEAVIFFIILASVTTLIMRKYLSKLCEAYIDESYLYLNNGKNEEKIELDNIKSIDYHPFFISILTEGIIVVDFKKQTSIGNRIFIYPTNLDRKKNYKLNRKILNLMNEMVENYKKRNN